MSAIIFLYCHFVGYRDNTLMARTRTDNTLNKKKSNLHIKNGKLLYNSLVDFFFGLSWFLCASAAFFSVFVSTHIMNSLKFCASFSNNFKQTVAE